MSKIATNMTLSITAGLVTLLIGIVLLEAFHYHKSSDPTESGWVDPNTHFDSQLGWSVQPNRTLHIPNWGTVSSNSQGYRSEEIKADKKHILVLGDSVTWGYGMSDDQIFSHYLQQMLKGTDYQVHNLGVSGYGVGQYYLYLKRHLSNFPSVDRAVFILYAGNDLEDARGNYAYGKRKPLFVLEGDKLVLKNNRIFKYCLRNLFAASFLVDRLNYRLPWFRQFQEYIAGDILLSEEETKEVAAHVLEKSQKLVESHGAKFSVIVSPSTYDLSESYEDFEWLRDYCENLGEKCVNFKEVLLKQEIPATKFYLEEEHYNEKGHQLLASTIKKAWLTSQ